MKHVPICVAVIIAMALSNPAVGAAKSYPQCDHAAENATYFTEVEATCQEFHAFLFASLMEHVGAEYTVRGFPVYVSPHVSDDKERVLEWIEIAGAVLIELESTKDIRGYFIERLRQSGVSFYLSFFDPDRWSALPGRTPDSTEPYTICPNFGGCYDPELRVIQDTLWPSPPSRWNNAPEWTSVRYTLIHELAHAFHDIALVDGYDNQCVLDAYRFSVERDGLHTHTYASWGHLEYFAEIVSYAMFTWRTPPNVDPCIPGTNVESQDQCVLVEMWPGSGFDPEYQLPVQNKWLLANYDFNGAALFHELLAPYGGRVGEVYDADRQEPDPLLTPLAGERTRDCDPSEWGWWPE